MEHSNAMCSVQAAVVVVRSATSARINIRKLIACKSSCIYCSSFSHAISSCLFLNSSSKTGPGKRIFTPVKWKKHSFYNNWRNFVASFHRTLYTTVAIGLGTRGCHNSCFKKISQYFDHIIHFRNVIRVRTSSRCMTGSNQQTWTEYWQKSMFSQRPAR